MRNGNEACPATLPITYGHKVLQVLYVSYSDVIKTVVRAINICYNYIYVHLSMYVNNTDCAQL